MTNAHFDLGWINNVIWRNISQQMPNDCCSADGNNSTYISWVWHFTPFFSIISFFSYFWPFSSFSWLAIFLAIAPAMVVFFTCNIFMLRNKLNSKLKYLSYFFPVLLALSFGTNRTLAFPHYEIYFLVFVLATVYFAATGSKLLYLSSIIALLILKEDSAFYLVILIWFIFFKKIKTKHLIKMTFLLISIPVLYLWALNLVDFKDPISPHFSDLTNLESHYLGKPFLSHVNFDFIVNRLNAIFASNFLLMFLISFLIFVGLSKRNGLMLRFMFSIFPYLFVSIFANSWVKGVMLNYEILPPWTSVLLSILLYQKNQPTDNQKKQRTNFIIVTFLLMGIVNGSTKQIFSTFYAEVPNTNTFNTINDVIKEAKEKDILLDNNFFVYNPKLVSFHSWLKENNEFKNGDCLLHLPNSNTVQKLRVIFPLSKFETKNFLKTNFMVTCRKN